MLAGQIFEETEGKKTLVILSDMRNSTTDMDLESQPLVIGHSSPSQRNLPGQTQIRALQVYVLGVDGSGRSTSYWESLQEFWGKFFRSAGANLRMFSTLRDLQLGWE
jgi:hypothetical protein